MVGNNCGHNPHHFRRALIPPQHQQRGWLLETAKARLIDLATYGRRSKYHGLAIVKTLFTHANGKKLRSCSREALGALVPALIHYTCLATFRISTAKWGFRPLACTTLQQLSQLSSDRLSRALAKLKPYLGTTRRWREDAYGFKGDYAVRQFSRQFFLDLGFSERQITAAQTWKQSKVRLSQTIIQQLTHPKTALLIAPPPVKPSRPAEAQRQLQRAKYPDLTDYALFILKQALHPDLTMLEFLHLPRAQSP